MTARYTDYMEIAARFKSTGTCGHAIAKGDRIGYARRSRETQCAECWDKWSRENDAAGFDEMAYSGQY